MRLKNTIKASALAAAMAVMPTGANAHNPKGKVAAKPKVEIYTPQTVIDPVLVEDYSGRNISQDNTAQFEKTHNKILYDQGYIADEYDFYRIIGHEIDHMVAHTSVAVKTDNLTAYQNAFIDWAEEARAHFQDNVMTVNMWAQSVDEKHPNGNIDIIPNTREYKEIREKIKSGQFKASDWMSNPVKQKEIIENIAATAANLPDSYMAQHLQAALANYNADKTLNDKNALTEAVFFNQNMMNALHQKFRDPVLQYSKADKQLKVKSDGFIITYTDLFPLFEKHIKEQFKSESMQKVFAQIPEKVAKDIEIKKRMSQYKFSGFRGKYVQLRDALTKKMQKWGFITMSTESKEWKALNDLDKMLRKLNEGKHLTEEQKQKMAQFSAYPEYMDKYRSDKLLNGEFEISSLEAATGSLKAKIQQRNAAHETDLAAQTETRRIAENHNTATASTNINTIRANQYNI